MKTVYSSADELYDELAFAIDAAELGIWDLNPVSNTFKGNARLKEWFGLGSDDDIPLTLALDVIVPADQVRVTEAIWRAMQFDSGGQYDTIYTIINPKTQVERVVRAKGKVKFNADKTAQRFNGILQDITEQYRIDQIWRESEERFRTLAEGTDVLIALADETSNATYFNKAWTNLTGRSMNELLAFGWADLIHPDDRKAYVNIYLSAFARRVPFTGEFRLLSQTGDYRWLLANGPARFRPDGSFAGYISSCVDITDRKQAEEALLLSERRFRSIIEEASVATMLFVGPQHYIEVANETMIRYLGKGPSIIGKPLIEVLPELDGQPFLQILDTVYTTGVAYEAEAAEAQLVIDGQLRSFYFTFSYKPLRNASGEVYGILDTSVDVTEQVLTQRALERSEQNLRSVVESAPFPIGVYVGPEKRIQLANQAIMAIWGKGTDVIGKRYTDVLPELSDQAIFSQLEQVYATGVPFHAKNRRLNILVNGETRPYFFNYSFTPLFDGDGTVYGVMSTAADVTDLALAKQQVEETEAALRGAIELAELGAWELDATTMQVTYSDRIKGWFGFGHDQTQADTLYSVIHEKDRLRVEQAILAALTPGGAGVYDEEYVLIEPSGYERIIHAHGKALFDEQGRPKKISGTAQDVTEQRRVQQELERQVQERTQLLQALVRDLERSNANLQQFAYVASHDLQEPLRKIRSFGNLLIDQYGDQLGDGNDLLNRMQAAASRMSVLIQDLLTFSRISTRQETATSVDLAQLIDTVLADLELRIQETEAVIDIGPLPKVQGDTSQLGQLFQNLLNNALKFNQPSQPPRVQVRAQTMTADQLPADVRPTRPATAYHRIDVIDNGIGFDEKYTDRIFQVFQRLHGRGQYDGTGIGLAICEKVAANHGGAITATSQPNQGATFSVYLPVWP
ncbi:PAS domain S-box protein [Fibrella sp. WM1]|uniref:PAS domain S-box protein n=1 Tax=Fibrella musci TaxID=3242485 RepID=UPI0035200B4B